jgi:hypothetical protein
LIDVTPLSLAEVLDTIEAFLRRYVAFVLLEQATAIALWIAHTYVIADFDVSPYLAITSAERQCGKTLLLDLLELLVFRPWRAVLPSDAVVYRKIDKERPTLLLDEADAIFSRGADRYEGLRALLNAGNRRGTKVPRCAAYGADLVDFAVFCAKAIAGIGELPSTVADRSIPIRLQRRNRQTEPVDRFRRREVEPAAVELVKALRAALAGHDMRESRPALPVELSDRAADGWEPLLATADAAGEAWGQRARAAALVLHGAGLQDTESEGIRLLSDIRAVFGGQDVERLSTNELLAALCADEGAPWGDYRGRTLSAHRLAALLSPHRIRSSQRRDNGPAVRGYDRADFADAWARYLRPEPLVSTGASKRDTVTPYPGRNTDAMTTSKADRHAVTVRVPSGDTVRSSAEPVATWHCGLDQGTGHLPARRADGTLFCATCHPSASSSIGAPEVVQ